MNCDDVTGENIKEHNPNSPQILDYPYRNETGISKNNRYVKQ